MKRVVAVLLLGGGLGALGVFTAGPGTRLTEPPSPAVTVLDAAPSQLNQGVLRTSVLARPLFAPDRRPAVAALPAAMTLAAPVPPPLGFIGTVRTEGRLQAAVTLAGKRWLIAVGETVAGWQVEAIGLDHLLLRSSDGSAVQRVGTSALPPILGGSPVPMFAPPAAGLFPIPPIPPQPNRPR